MNDPGTLPVELAAESLRRISPSRFIALLKCPLREVWQAAGNNPLLPTSPTTHIGSITHKLLEFAALSAPSTLTKESLEAEWNRLVEDTEERMAANWVERQNLPLKRTAWRYAVRRIRALKCAITIASGRSKGPYQETRRQGGRGAEQWVEANDGTVGGLIDRIVWTPAGAILRDYKSGSVVEHINDAYETVLRSDYVAQMKLYAALFRDTYGQWPVAIELAPLRGSSISVQFTTDECAALLSDAKSLLESVNEAISAGGAMSLATPAPHTCKFCQYRPACLPYRRARGTCKDNAEWPHDLWGTVANSTTSMNGHRSITLKPSRQHQPIAVVSQLVDDGNKHPALAAMMTGDSLALYNLQPICSPTNFRETRSTTIYTVAKDR